MKNTLTTSSRAIVACCLALSLLACEKAPTDNIKEPTDAEQYFIYSIGGLQGAATAPEDSLSAARVGTTTSLFGSSGNFFIQSSFNGAEGNGEYPMQNMMLFVNNRYFVPNGNMPKVFISSFGSAGDYIVGSYNGNLKDSLTQVSYSVNGVFKIKRKS